MTKTKRQLRAEAVERLSKLERSGESYFPSDVLHCVTPPREAGIDELIDLLTDDEPPEGDEWKAGAEYDGVGWSSYGVKRTMTNLEWLYGYDAAFAAGVDYACKYVSGFGIDCDNEREWLMAEHVGVCGTEPAESVLQADLPDTDCGQIADMSENAPGCVRNDASASENGVSDGVEGSDDANESQVVEHAPGRLTNGGEMLYDTREKLEADVLEWCRESNAVFPASRAASKHGAEIRKLKAQLEDAQVKSHVQEMHTLPEGVEWPRYADGGLVRVGDEIGFEGGVRRVECIEFRSGTYTLQTEHESRVSPFGHTVDRPPLLAADGQPIEVGQTLYGESDGKAWTVDRIDHGQPYPVMAHCGSSRRGLKPRWLKHGKPDSWQRIADELRAINGDLYAHSGAADLELIAERIEKLAKEEA